MLDFLTMCVILGLLGVALFASTLYRERYFSVPYSAFDDDYDCR